MYQKITKTKKILTAVILAVGLGITPVFGYSPLPVFQPKEQLRSGVSWQIGYPNAANVIATLDNGTLTISGTGAVVSENSLAPWFSVKDQIINVDVQSGVTNIGKWYFLDCSNLVRANIASTVTRIEGQAFRGCTNLKRIRIPHNVTFIGVECFLDCINLETINIPSSISTIEGAAFRGCHALQNITVRWTSPLYIDVGTVFNGLNTQNINLYIPKGRLSVYNASNWQNFNVVESNEWKLLCPILRNTQFNGTYSETVSGTTTSLSTAEYNQIYTYFRDFENLVEYLVPSLDLILDIKDHTSLVTSTATYFGYACIDRNDVISVLNSYGFNSIRCNSNYDGVITVAGFENPDIPVNYGGLTWLGADYTFIPYKWWFDADYLYYYTLYVFVHEWLHQLESYFPNRLGVTVPNLHEGGDICTYEGDYHDAYLTNSLYGCGSSGINSNWFQYPPTNSSSVGTIAEEVYSSASLQIYPNPTKDDLFIKSALQINKIEIYSLTGFLLLTENNFSEKISLSALLQGVYLIKVYTNEGIVVRKIVKE